MLSVYGYIIYTCFSKDCSYGESRGRILQNAVADLDTALLKHSSMLNIMGLLAIKNPCWNWKSCGELGGFVLICASFQ